MKKLDKKFYTRNTLTVAQELLGKVLVHNYNGQKIIGRITETEAYMGFKDKASHASRGRTKRTELMFGPAGYAYIYMIYGMYFCFNIVTEQKDYPAAVLIRALEPLHNINSKADGPGKLCRTMHITKELNGIDLCANTLFISDDNFQISSNNITAAKRIGINYAGESKNNLWRFYIK